MREIFYLRLSSILLISLTGVCVFMLSGCYNASDYSGDGQLKDNGPTAAKDRYVLNLGAVDLGRHGTQKYKIKNLPEANFVAGIYLSVESKDEDVIASKKMNTLLSLSLSDSDGKRVFSRQSNLADWSWARRRDMPTNAFIYGSDPEDTYFVPEKHAEYLVTFTVLEVDPNQPKHNAVLLFKSGGWK